MPEYIEREAVLQDIGETVIFTVRGGTPLPNAEMRGANKVIDRVKSAPAADVVEVRHGEWKLLSERQFLDGSYATTFYCSLCSREVTVNHEQWYNAKKALFNMYPYCHCGAKMDGKGEGE